MGQSRTLPPRMQNMYQRANSWNGAQQWQRPSSSSSSSSGVTGERPQHHHHHHQHHHRGERSERGTERGERLAGAGGAPAVHVLPPRMRAVKAPRHQTSNTALDAGFGFVAPPSPPSPSDPLGLGRNLDQLNAARPSVSRASYNDSSSPMSNIPNPNVLYTTGGTGTGMGLMMMDQTRTSQLSPDAPVFQPRFGMPASAPLYQSSVDEFPFPSFIGGGGGGGSGGSSYQGGDNTMVVGNVGDLGIGSNTTALGVSFSVPSPSTSPTRTSPTSGSPPKFTKLPPIAPPPMTKPDDNTPPPPAYLVNFLASKFGPSSPSSTTPSASTPTMTMPLATMTAIPTPVVANVPAFIAAPVQISTPVVEEPAMVLYDSALSSSSPATVAVTSIPVAVPPPTAKMIPSSSSTMSLIPTVPILKLPTPPNKRSSPSSPSTPRPAPSPPSAPKTPPPKAATEPTLRRPSAPSRSSYIVADMLLNRIRSSPLRPGLGPRRATSPAMSGSGSTSPVSRSCLSKEVLMEDVVMLSLPVSS